MVSVIMLVVEVPTSLIIVTDLLAIELVLGLLFRVLDRMFFCVYDLDPGPHRGLARQRTQREAHHVFGKFLVQQWSCQAGACGIRIRWF